MTKPLRTILFLVTTLIGTSCSDADQDLNSEQHGLGYRTVQQAVASSINAKFFKYKSNGKISAINSHNWSRHWSHVTAIGHDRLVFYRRHSGYTKIFTYDGFGNLTEQERTHWPTTIDDIVNAPWQDVAANMVRYHRESGTLEAYDIDNDGDLQLAFTQTLRNPEIHTDEGIGWDIVVPMRYDGSDILMAYSRITGQTLFLYYDGTQLVEYASPQYRRVWDQIVAGQFDDDPDHELVFHNQDTGQTLIWDVGSQTIADLPRAGAASTALITVGRFGGAGLDDVMLYQGGYGSTSGGRGILYTDNSSGNYSRLRTNTGWSGRWTHLVTALRNSGSNSFLIYRNPRHVTMRIVFAGLAQEEIDQKLASSGLATELKNLNRAFAAAGLAFELENDYSVTNDPTLVKHGEKDGPTGDEVDEWLEARSEFDGKVPIVVNKAVGGGFSCSVCGHVTLGTGFANGSTLWAHELGHFFRAGGHTFSSLTTVEEVEDYLKRIESDSNHASVHNLDVDRLGGYVFDTIPGLLPEFFANSGYDKCDDSRVIRFNSNNSTGIAVVADPHNVMGYSRCNGFAMLTKDQIRSIRQWIYSERSDLF